MLSSRASVDNGQDDLKADILRSVEIVVHNTDLGETHRLHDQNYELDAIFDIFKGSLRLVEKAHNQAIWPETLHKETISLDLFNTGFLNLEGLNDGSILFSFRPESPIKIGAIHKLRICHQSHEFMSEMLDSPLRKAIFDCVRDDRIFCLRLPNGQHHGWRTIALILLTYRKITPRSWYRIVVSESLGDIAGFDWKQFCAASQQ